MWLLWELLLLYLRWLMPGAGDASLLVVDGVYVSGCLRVLVVYTSPRLLYLFLPLTSKLSPPPKRQAVVIAYMQHAISTRRGRQLYTCGNGGSELSLGFRRERCQP